MHGVSSLGWILRPRQRDGPVTKETEEAAEALGVGLVEIAATALHAGRFVCRGAWRAIQAKLHPAVDTPSPGEPNASKSTRPEDA